MWGEFTALNLARQWLILVLDQCSRTPLDACGHIILRRLGPLYLAHHGAASPPALAATEPAGRAASLSRWLMVERDLASSGDMPRNFNVGVAAPRATGLLFITPSSTNFGNVALGSYSTKSVVLNNTSTSSITISQANVAGREFNITGLSLPLTLATGQNSTFSVVLIRGVPELSLAVFRL
jgi:hypothetical protein